MFLKIQQKFELKINFKRNQKLFKTKNSHNQILPQKTSVSQNSSQKPYFTKKSKPLQKPLSSTQLNMSSRSPQALSHCVRRNANKTTNKFSGEQQVWKVVVAENKMANKVLLFVVAGLWAFTLQA